MDATAHVSLVLSQSPASITASLSRAPWLNRVSPYSEVLFIPDKKTSALRAPRLAFLRLMKAKL